ncbi:MAG: substrate-binding domain-containing protein [Gemmatimonadetes bacterium]|nr:substrate-binding domain-containing protein [Gemmatimonadota bacterium]
MEKLGILNLAACMATACLVLAAGCSEPDETATKGYIRVASAEVAFPYIEKSAQKFELTYNEAFVDVGRTTSREALVDLAEGRSRMAVMSREPNETEIAALSTGERQFVTRTVAHDALVVILHGDNPVDELTVGQLKDIYTGKITNWREAGGRDVLIRPLVRDRNSGTYEVFQDRVLGDSEYGAGVYPCSTMAVLTGLAGSHPGAIGITGLLMTTHAQTMGYYKIIRVAEEEGGQYILPTQNKILEEPNKAHKKLYPLRRPFVLCYFKSSSFDVNLVSGFVTFLTAVKGQQLAIDGGIVPATMPVRVVKLTE